jgi:hypothetical protein
MIARASVPMGASTSTRVPEFPALALVGPVLVPGDGARFGFLLLDER